MNVIGVRYVKCVELRMGSGIDEIGFLFSGNHIIIKCFELLGGELALGWNGF